jgi:hypothetical protein
VIIGAYVREFMPPRPKDIELYEDDDGNIMWRDRRADYGPRGHP